MVIGVETLKALGRGPEAPEEGDYLLGPGKQF